MFKKRQKYSTKSKYDTMENSYKLQFFKFLQNANIKGTNTN